MRQGTALPVFVFVLLALTRIASAQDPSLVLKDGGLEFPDGTVQQTSAVVTNPPPAVTVPVDCGSGDSISEALRRHAFLLTIEITGICNESVVISRDWVTLRGISNGALSPRRNPGDSPVPADPNLDGVDGGIGFALRIDGARFVTVEDLQLTGAPVGLGIFNSSFINVNNVRLHGNNTGGAAVGTLVSFSDVVVTNNSQAGLSVGVGSRLSCSSCLIQDNGADGLAKGIVASGGASVALQDSTVEGYPAVELTRASLDVTGTSAISGLPGPSTEGFAIEASEQSVAWLTETVVTGPLRLILSEAVLEDVTHSMTGFTWPTEVGGNAGLYVEGSTNMAGSVGLEVWAKGFFDGTAGLSGDLTCAAGADAFCQNPSVIGGTSSCAQCMIPE